MSEAPPAAPLPPGGAPWDALFWLDAEDGVQLRAAVWNPGGPQGLALLLTGRTEYLEKAAIPAAELVARGWAVASVDWRGQGLSDRLLANPLKGHVDAFPSFHRDIDALLAAPQVAALGPVRLVLAHSMGGAIATGALLRGRVPLAPEARIVLSAPMLGLRMSGALRLASRATIWAARQLGRLDGWPPLGTHDQPYTLGAFEGNVLTHDRAVWDWMGQALRAVPMLQLAMPTIGWVAAAEAETAWIATAGRLPAPALIVLGSEEAVVDAAIARTRAAPLGAELAIIPGALHESLIETAPIRAQAWAAIDRFLAR